VGPGYAFWAHFTSTDPSGCVTTRVHVFGQTGDSVAAGDAPTTARWAQATIEQFDYCAYREVRAGSGRTQQFAFRLSSPLRAATLRATIPVTSYDFAAGAYGTAPVAVALAWTGEGELVRYPGRPARSREGAYLAVCFDQGALRAARAAGTVSDGATEFAPPGANDGGSLADIAAGYVLVRFAPVEEWEC
jgi:hypothetical protein